MNCKELVELLLDFVAGELAPPRRAELEQHLGCCGPCQAYYETYQITIRLSRKLCCRPLPEGLEQKLWAVFRAMEKEQGEGEAGQC